MDKILKPYIIGETSYNHEGDKKYLIKMVDDIAEIGLDAVKFHLLFDLESYVTSSHPLYNEIKKWLFRKEEWDEIINHSVGKKLDVIALCNDIDSLKYVNEENKKISAIELHAVALNDWFLLQEASKFKKTVILGIGGSTIEEINYAIELLKNNGKEDILLMYGFQNYPTNYTNINLLKMLKIKKLFELPVGYADHTTFDDPNNEIISVMAMMMGFNVLEKHYTPDYGKKRIDYQSAVGKSQMIKIKSTAEMFLKIYGTGELKMTDAELNYGNTGYMKKAIVAKQDIKKGEKLSLDNVIFKRTKEESSVKQNQLFQLVGLETIKEIRKDEIIDFSKVKYRFKKDNEK